MERYYLFIVFLSFLLCCVTSTVHTRRDIKSTRFEDQPLFTDQELNAKDQFDNLLLVMLNDTRLNSIPVFSFIFSDDDSVIHVGYTQTFKGYPVVGGNWVGHFQSNHSFEVTDNLKYLRDVDLNITMGVDSVLNISKLTIPRCSIDLHLNRCSIINTSTELVIFPNRNISSQGNLVYKVITSLRLPSEQWTTFVSARSGTVYSSMSNRRSATGLSTYNGAVNVDSTPYSSKYFLQDESRQMGTYNCYNDAYCDSFAPYLSKNDVWNSDPSATSVGWASSHTYDFFSNVLGRSGIDGNSGPEVVGSVNGIPLFPNLVHFDSGYNDAFFSDSGIFYGDGDGVIAGPVVSLDIVAHEFTHGVIRYILGGEGFIYQDESGALEESFCDVFGAMVERSVFGENNNTWRIGEDFYTPKTLGDAVRYLDNPHAADGQVGSIVNVNPDHYSERYNGTLDHGGVHANAGIPSKAFHLLSVGGKHRIGGPSMTGIGADAATQIWWRALNLYVTSSSKFNDARIATLLAARDIYGSSSTQYFAVQMAWGLVGVGSVPNPRSSELVQNGLLESSSSPWVLTNPSAVVHVPNGVNPHSGSGYVIFGGSNAVSGSMSQTSLTISSTVVAANLTFWTLISTSESSSYALDMLVVSVKDANSGASYGNIDSISNLHAGLGWIRRGPYNLSSLKGKTIKIEFQVANNGNNPTTFKVDDVSLQTYFY